VLEHRELDEGALVVDAAVPACLHERWMSHPRVILTPW
jgi:hypothetical protein